MAYTFTNTFSNTFHIIIIIIIMRNFLKWGEMYRGIISGTGSCS